MQVRRNARGTLAALMNFLLVGAAGVVTIGNEMVKPEASTLLLVIGAVLVFWALVIGSGLLRPVIIDADDDGISLRQPFGTTRYSWADLAWADFESSNRFVVIAVSMNGRDSFTPVSRRGVDPEAMTRFVTLLQARRPDLPMKRPSFSREKQT